MPRCAIVLLSAKFPFRQSRDAKPREHNRWCLCRTLAGRKEKSSTACGWILSSTASAKSLALR
eukprot:9787233-Prorocentrum_lima.AAC.1